MGAGKLSNGFIKTGTRIQLETFTQQYRKHCALFKILFSWSQNSFLDSCAERMSNGRWGEPEHRILGLWEVQPNTDHQPPTAPIQTSSQRLISIFTPSSYQYIQSSHFIVKLVRDVFVCVSC